MEARPEIIFSAAVQIAALEDMHAFLLEWLFGVVGLVYLLGCEDLEFRNRVSVCGKLCIR